MTRAKPSSNRKVTFAIPSAATAAPLPKGRARCAERPPSRLRSSGGVSPQRVSKSANLSYDKSLLRRGFNHKEKFSWKQIGAHLVLGQTVASYRPSPRVTFASGVLLRLAAELPALPPCRASIGSRLRPAGFSIGVRHSPPPKPPRRPNVGTVFLFGEPSLAAPHTPQPSVFHRSLKDLCVARREKYFTCFFVDKCL